MLKKVSLRSRIFISMIGLVLLAFGLIAGMTIVQYKEQADDYHLDRLSRKEAQVQKNLLNSYENKLWNVGEAISKEVEEELTQIAYTQNINFNLYTVTGELIYSAHFTQDDLFAEEQLPVITLSPLRVTDHHLVKEVVINGNEYLSSYSYLLNQEGELISILHIPYFEDNSFSNMELREFLIRLVVIYMLMLVLAIGISYVFSSYVTRSIDAVTQTLDKTNLAGENEKIELSLAVAEMTPFIEAYNKMVDQLKTSADELAKNQREMAWRNMAKQVAHEIKNPLTPMRLSAQMFEHKFSSTDPELKEQVKKHVEGLIHQIDHLSTIAEAFSNFAQLPTQNNEVIDVKKELSIAMELFSRPYIHLHLPEGPIYALMDKSQLLRMVTNLMKNAKQATEEREDKQIDVRLVQKGTFFEICVKDNGTGISPEAQPHIYEPRFTTKNSGTGLGLAMVKGMVENYKGSIRFTTEKNKGTEFCLSFPLDSSLNEKA